MADRRAQIEARLAAATPGPWRVDRYDHGGGRAYVEEPRRTLVADFYQEGDREMLAHAPDDLRWLLDALAEAEAERERWKEVADAADDVIRAVLAALYRGPDTDAVIRAKKVMAERDALAALVREAALETYTPDGSERFVSAFHRTLGERDALAAKVAAVEALAEQGDYHWIVVDAPDGEYVQEGSPCVSVDDLRDAIGDAP